MSSEIVVPFLGSVAHHVALRAVACKGWRWVPGMLTVGGERVAHIDSHGSVHVNTWLTSDYLTDPSLPDLTDPATVGCLLALVREAWGYDVHAEVNAFPGEDKFWRAWIDTEDNERTGATEAEALVAALESAP